MGFLNSIKKAFAPKAKEIENALGLDGKVTELFDQLVEKLEGLNVEGKLDEMAQNALTASKPALDSFKADGSAVKAFVEKAKTFVEGLSTAALPEEIKELVSKVTALIAQAL